MLGEKAERRSAAPISSATEWKRFLKISSSAASTRMLSQHQVAVFIHIAGPVRRHDGGRAVLDDDGGSCEFRATGQPLAVVKQRLRSLLAEPDGLSLDHCRSYVATTQLSSLATRRGLRRLRRRHNQPQPQVGDFEWPFRTRVSVGTLVFAMKPLAKVAGEGHRKLIGLARVANVEPALRNGLARGS